MRIAHEIRRRLAFFPQKGNQMPFAITDELIGKMRTACMLRYRFRQDELEDVIQNALVDLLRYGREDVANPAAYACRVALNCAANHVKARKKANGLYLRSIAEPQDADSSICPENDVIREESYDLLWKSFADLPEEDQELLRQIVVEKLPATSVAKMQSVAYSTVTRRLAKILTRLRSHLDGTKREPIADP